MTRREEDAIAEKIGIGPRPHRLKRGTVWTSVTRDRPGSIVVLHTFATDDGWRVQWCRLGDPGFVGTSAVRNGVPHLFRTQCDTTEQSRADAKSGAWLCRSLAKHFAKRRRKTKKEGAK